MNLDGENLADLQDYRHTLHSAGVRLSREILRYKYCIPTGVKKLLCKSPHPFADSPNSPASPSRASTPSRVST